MDRPALAYRRFESNSLRHVVRGCGDGAPGLRDGREFPASSRGFGRGASANPNRRRPDGAPYSAISANRLRRRFRRFGKEIRVTALGRIAAPSKPLSAVGPGSSGRVLEPRV